MEERHLDGDPGILNYEELLTRCMGKIEFVERVLGKFGESFDSDLDELEHDLAEMDSDGVTRIAHRMKGASANVAAPRLRNTSEEIEKLGRENRLEEIGSCVQQLRGEWSDFLRNTSALPSVDMSH